MKILVSGCGSIGKRHLDNLKLLQAGKLIAQDISPERCAQIEKQLGIKSYQDFGQALEAGPEVVLVCTPPSLHIHQALQAARQGCHLFIEKPLSHNLVGVDTLLTEVSRASLTVMVGCNFRFHWGMKLARKLVDSGAVGKPLFIRAQFGQYLPDWHPWEDYRRGYTAQKSLGGGIILDAIHELDYSHWLMGPASQVFCSAGKLSDLEMDVEDTAEILLRFAGGTMGEVHLDCVQRSYNRSFELAGSEGTITWSYQDNVVKSYSAAAKKWAELKGPSPYDANSMYVEEMRHFLDCVRAKSTPLVDLPTGKAVLEIALAAKRSALSGQPVTL